YGLEKVMAGEMLAFPHNVFGIALNLEEDQVGVVLLGESQELKEGDVVKRTNTIMSVPVGQELVGRVVNPLGQTVDGKGPIATRARWTTPLWLPLRLRSRLRFSTSRPTRRVPWGNISAITRATPSRFTTIFPSTPRPIVKFRCCSGVLRGAKRSPATCSIFTR